MDEIAPELFRIEVPLPESPLKAVNSYVVRGKDRNLIIDTGMRRDECEQVLVAALEELNIDLSRTDFFITHLHADHLGLVTRLATDTSTVYMGEEEAGLVSGFQDSGTFWGRVAEFARTGGIPEDAIQEAMKEHPGIKHSPPKYPEFTIVGEGDYVSAGDYRFECVFTPGHTPGHFCLYEPDRRYFVSGDHVLGDITPNISAWFGEANPLEEYLASLDKVSTLDVELVLPGHRRVFTDLQGRIAELKSHHDVRTEEVVKILAAGKKTVYEVASEMTWSIVADGWSNFPVMQKWFATAEAGTHLQYLARSGAVEVEARDDVYVFSV